MCGIAASIERGGGAPRKVIPALRELEYRGYDSWGVASFHDGQFDVIKRVGHLPPSLDLPGANISLGHTRWATHGRVTVENAHPLVSSDHKIALVGNGVVENHQELRQELSGYRFVSETDTEVIVHLIDKEIKKENSLAQAVKRVFPRLSGQNALVVSDGQSLIAARKGVPLVVGKLDDGYMVASDMSVLLPHTNKISYLANNQMAVLGEEAVGYSFDSGETKPLEFEEDDREEISGPKNNYPHFMLQEISEEPDALERLLADEKQVDRLAGLIKDTGKVYFLGCGSASYAAAAGSYYFSKFANKLVFSCAASEFGNFRDTVQSDDVVLAFSQSGETIDILDQVEEVQKKGARVIPVTNSQKSSLHRMTDDRLMLYAGREKAVLATKTFTNMIGSMVFLSSVLGGNSEYGRSLIAENIVELREVFDRRWDIEDLANKYLGARDLFVLGKGLNFPIARESALKIKEGSYIHAEGFAAGELKHGVIALVEEGTPFVVFAPDDETRPTVLSNAMEVKSRGAKIIGVGAQDDSVFDDFFEINSRNSPIPNAMFGQLFGYYAAVGRGLNPDMPRSLAKSVVVR